MVTKVLGKDDVEPVVKVEKEGFDKVLGKFTVHLQKVFLFTEFQEGNEVFGVRQGVFWNTGRIIPVNYKVRSADYQRYV